MRIKGSQFIAESKSKLFKIIFSGFCSSQKREIEVMLPTIFRRFVSIFSYAIKKIFDFDAL